MTVHAERMKTVVTRVHPTLKEVGFRKARHTFNRETTDGIVHVLNFQMGPHPIGPYPEVPPIRLNLYGLFTVNLGVFVPEMQKALLAEVPVGKVVQEYICEIRRRLPELIPSARLPRNEKGVAWWPLSTSPETLASEMNDLITRFGLPFLDSLSTREQIIGAWRRHGNAIGFPPRGQLSIGVMLHAMGRCSEAEELLADYMRRDHKPGHRAFAEKVITKLGLTP